VLYPRAAVHARDLAGELIPVWYVYRDGHWTDPRLGRSLTEDEVRNAGRPRRSALHVGSDPG
jgi:hypothetical protein